MPRLLETTEAELETLSEEEEEAVPASPTAASRGTFLGRRAVAALLGLGATGAAAACVVARSGSQVPGSLRASVASAIGEADAPAGCHDAVAGEKCFDSVSWVMTEGIYGHPEWYPGQDYSSRFEEFQAAMHKSDASSCPAPCKDPAKAARKPGIPGASLDLPQPQQQRQPVTFYMYRVQSQADYPLENVNTANLGGVMWYLHNEIVPSVAVHRKYGITRMLRYKVTIEPTWEYWNVHRRLFSGFTAFDKGRCTAHACGEVYKRYGFIPGCQFLDAERLPYYGAAKTRVDGKCEGDRCNAPVWYALPGPCPDKPYQEKSGDCLTQAPGGLCGPGEELGTRSCTFQVENAGEISIDELAGIASYADFYAAGHREYDVEQDKGDNCTFWDSRHDAAKNKVRMDRAKELFKQKFPSMPACDDLPEPPCDFDAYFPEEMTWPTYSAKI